MTRPLAAPVILVLVAGLGGCLGPGAEVRSACTSPTPPSPGPGPGGAWPDLDGATVVVLDHGAFDYLFGCARERFAQLTGGRLEHIAAQDTGDALNRAIREKADPSFDVVYGLDNAYLGKAVAANALRPYTPALAHRVNASHVFFGAEDPWPATPADHGYIAVNVDLRTGLSITGLDDVREHADELVTPDPRNSSPGLGFLLATVATYPEGSEYDWRDYWNDLFAGGVKVTADWTTAYTQDFTGGYSQWEDGFAGQRALVTSYTTSPAYEAFYGNPERNGLVLAPGATFHQVETVAIAANARDPDAAKAFVEFVLSDAFQDLHAETNAMYPVVDGLDVARVYAGIDPPPGSFQPAALEHATLTSNVDRWVREWTDLYEAHQS